MARTGERQLNSLRARPSHARRDSSRNSPPPLVGLRVNRTVGAGVTVTRGLVPGGASFRQSMRLTGKGDPLVRASPPPIVSSEEEEEEDAVASNNGESRRRRQRRRRALMGLGMSGMMPSLLQPPNTAELMTVLLAALSCDAVTLYAVAPHAHSHLGDFYRVRPNPPAFCSLSLLLRRFSLSMLVRPLSPEESSIGRVL